MQIVRKHNQIPHLAPPMGMVQVINSPIKDPPCPGRGVMGLHVDRYITATSYGADAAIFRQNFRRQGLLWFFQSLAVGYTLVRQRPTNLSATTAVRVSVFCFAVFRILSVTFSLTRALCQSLAHAQQHFSVYCSTKLLSRF